MVGGVLPNELWPEALSNLGKRFFVLALISVHKQQMKYSSGFFKNPNSLLVRNETWKTSAKVVECFWKCKVD